MDRAYGSNAGDQGRKAYSGRSMGDLGGRYDDYYDRSNWRYETRQVDNRGEYARLCQAKGLTNRQEDADAFADLVEKGANALEAFSHVHRG